MIDLISTDKLKQIICKYVDKQEEPILHVPIFNCDEFNINTEPDKL